MLLGAGRKTKNDSIDFSAGITMVKRLGIGLMKVILCAYFTQTSPTFKRQKGFPKMLLS